MGNGFLNCTGLSDYCGCSGKTNIELKNNISGNGVEINLDKAKGEQRIITNTYIPNCKVEYSPEDTNAKQKTYSKKNNSIKLSSNQINMNLQKNFNIDTKEGEDSNINFTHHFNDNNRNEKNVSFSPSITMTTTINNNNNKIGFNKYNIEMLNYLNKLRNNPKSMIEEIENIKKNNINIINDMEYIVSEDTNEMIKLNVYIDKIKDNIIVQQPVDILKLNNKLKINSNLENIEITDKLVNELVIRKKREIYRDFPRCFFYPIFIKDTKLNILLLLTNNKFLEQIYNKDFTDFYVTTFNEKSNRFFAILCLA
jgi:hypothetical protein